MRAKGFLCGILAVALVAGGCQKKDRDLTTDLHRAAEKGDLSQVQMLIARGAHLNARDDKGCTPLHLAAENGHNDVVEVLVRCGAQLDSEDERSRTPAITAMVYNHRAIVEHLLSEGAAETLSIAAYLGDISKVKSLIEGGADVNAGAGTVWTALHYAACYNQHVVTEALIAGGARVDSSNKRGTTPLHTAAEEGHFSMVQLLLAHGANIDVRDSEGATPLYEALRRERVDVVELLASSGADINARPVSDDTPLCYAAGHGLVGVVKLLLTKGANANTRITANQFRPGLPLEYAIEGGYIDVAEALLAGGADVNGEDESGWPLLHIAIGSSCQSGAEAALLLERPAAGAAQADWDRYNAAVDQVRKTLAVQIVRLLIAHGADAKAENKEGLTPLHCAVYQGHREIVQLLLAAGAEVNAEDNRGNRPLHDLFGSHRDDESLWELIDYLGVVIEERSEDPFQPARTPGGKEEREQRMGVLGILLKHGADVNAVGENGLTPLHIAARAGCTRAVEVLIDRGADLNARSRAIPQYGDPQPAGQTPLLLALRSGYLNVAQLLIDRGADVNATDETGETALLCGLRVTFREGNRSIRMGDIGRTFSGQNASMLEAGLRKANRKLVGCLLTPGANASPKDEDGATPLHYAARTGDEALAELLLAHGAEISAIDGDGVTPLHDAARASTGVVALLLAHGAAVRVADKRGDTPLHEAVLRGHRQIVELLLAHNPDLNVRNSRGRTPLDEANRRGHTDIVQLLTAEAKGPHVDVPARETKK